MQGGGPVDGLGDAGEFEEVHLAQALDEGDDLGGEAFGDAGGLGGEDGAFAVGCRVVDPLVEAAAADGVVHLARAVAGEDDDGGCGGADGAEFGDGDLVVGEEFEEEGLEWFVGAVEFVDEEDGGGLGRVDGAEEGAFLEELAAEDAAGEGSLVAVAAGLGEADGHELAGVVPFIGGGGEIHAVVALQTHEAAAEPGGQDLGDFGLAGAGLALEEERAAHGERQVDGGGERLVCDVAAGGEEGGGFATEAGRGRISASDVAFEDQDEDEQP